MEIPTVKGHEVRIELLADHPDLAETIARWHWDEWGDQEPDAPLATWIDGMRRRNNRDRIPITFVAFDGEEPIGSALLVASDMKTHPELTPWLAGVYVVPERRGQGVGTVLVRHTMRAAAALGVTRLYLHTETARGFYEKLGWRAVFEEHYHNMTVTVMDLEPTVEER